MTKEFNAVLTREGEWVVAQCLEVDIASQGKSEKEAMENLSDALALHFTPPVATVLPTVRHFEMELAA